jgi:hypothetical protein
MNNECGIFELPYSMCGKDRTAQTVGERSQYAVDPHFYMPLGITGSIAL